MNALGLGLAVFALFCSTWFAIDRAARKIADALWERS